MKKKFHIRMVGTSNTIMDITREVLDIKDAVDIAFEEAFCDPALIATIELEFLEE